MVVKTSDIYILSESWNAPSDEEIELVTQLLEKEPRGEFHILVRNEKGEPSVIKNAPFFYDGTPMPTRYWLVDKELGADVARIESDGVIKQVQEEIPIEVISVIHERYSEQRDALIVETYDGPRPSGGVGGTRQGVKCLHTHVANYLATGDDVVGMWTLHKIAESKNA